MAKNQKQEYSWDDYAEEAAGEPFRLRKPDGEVVEFEMPSGTAIMRIQQGFRAGDAEAMLRGLVGDNWHVLEELLAKTGHKALRSIVDDMMAHFDLYDEVTLVGPGGGRVKVSRPTEINALIEQGYRPLGEHQAS